MIPVPTAQPVPGRAARGPLSAEALCLSERLDEVRTLIRAIPTFTDGWRLHDTMREVWGLVELIAAHGHAEEHVVYPYIETFMSGSQDELATLRADHARLDMLCRAIVEWSPEQPPEALHELLVEFVEMSAAHLLIEGEDCMPVVHAHVLAGTEQMLFEAVEMETFDRVAGRSQGV